MLLEYQLDELRDRLNADAPAVPIWRAIVKRMGSRIWSSAEWKRRRKGCIASACGWCRTTVGPMTLQHPRQKPQPSEVLHRYFHDPHSPNGFARWYETDPERREEYSVEARTACPKCSGINVVKRLGTRGGFRGWYCQTQRGGKICRTTFLADEAQVTMKKRRNEHEWRARWLRYLKSEAGNECYRQAALDVIEHYREYISLRGTITLCRVCAFSADILQGKPCLSCGKGTSAGSDAYCRACSPEWADCSRCLAERSAKGLPPSRHAVKYATCFACHARHSGPPTAD
jgi:hypothetical protein